MKEREFTQRIYAAARDVPSAAELKELILLARLHGGGKLLEDLAACGSAGLGGYISRAKKTFPVAEDLRRDQIWTQIMVSMTAKAERDK